MDDEDKILLAGIGTFGALTYLALKKLKEKEDLSEESEPIKKSEDDKFFDAKYSLSKKEEEKEVPIYKDILELLFGKKDILEILSDRK
jgi:hypothetical protein